MAEWRAHGGRRTVASLLVMSARYSRAPTLATHSIFMFQVGARAAQRPTAQRLFPTSPPPGDKLLSRAGSSAAFPEPQEARLVRAGPRGKAPAGSCGGRKGLPRQAPHFPQAAQYLLRAHVSTSTNTPSWTFGLNLMRTHDVEAARAAVESASSSSRLMSMLLPLPRAPATSMSLRARRTSGPGCAPMRPAQVSSLGRGTFAHEVDPWAWRPRPIERV